MIRNLVDKISEYDMVVGARGGKNVNIPLIRRPAKWILNKLAEYITGTVIPDLNSGFRVFRKSTVKQYYNILPDKFSLTTTVTVAMLCDENRVMGLYQFHYIGPQVVDVLQSSQDLYSFSVGRIYSWQR
jgi:hypothetical protein